MNCTLLNEFPTGKEGRNLLYLLTLSVVYLVTKEDIDLPVSSLLRSSKF